MHRKHTPLLPGFPHRLGRPRAGVPTGPNRELNPFWEQPLSTLRSLFRRELHVVNLLRERMALGILRFTQLRLYCNCWENKNDLI